MAKDLRFFYEDELSLFRQESREFAKRYPKIAKNLLLEEDFCADPHIERMIQAFAYLTARVRMKLDDELPEIIHSMTDILYPHLQHAFPSCSVIHFDLDPKHSSLSTKYSIKKGVELTYGGTGQGQTATFQTCYPVDLWPIQMKNLAFLHQNDLSQITEQYEGAIDIELSSFSDQPITKLGIENLPFFVAGDHSFSSVLFEILCAHIDHIEIKDDAGNFKRAKNIKLVPMGFDAEHSLMPTKYASFKGFEQLREYAILPEKFRFVNMTGLEEWRGLSSSKSLTLRLYIKPLEHKDWSVMLARYLQDAPIKLFATPVINIFKKRAEPIKINHQKHAYPLVLDRKNPENIDLVQVQTVQRVTTKNGKEVVLDVPKMFEIHNLHHQQGHDHFWNISRKIQDDQHGRPYYELSLIDRELQSTHQVGDVITLSTLCSNHDLPTRIHMENNNQSFEFMDGQVIAKIKTLIKPTAPVPAQTGGHKLWSLLSHVSLDQLSLSNEGLPILREILHLCNLNRNPQMQKEIAALKKINIAATSQRSSFGAHRAFVTGSLVQLELDETPFLGQSAYLFSCVLNEFFSHYAYLNSFVSTEIASKQRQYLVYECQGTLGKNSCL